MNHRSQTNDPPAVGDAVVVDGSKFRIQAIEAGGIGLIAEAGPNWRHGVTVPLALSRLYWDPLAAVWRVG